MTKKQITQLSYEIVGHAITVHKNLGAGLLESIYETCLKYELEINGFVVEQQMRVPIFYKDLIMEQDLRLDLLVNNCIVVEVKAVKEILPVHQAQLLTYMKLLKVPQGLLLNFYTDNITKSKMPFVNEYFNMLQDE
jgi:GxxExxY protein